jgi:hypothetical protein
LAEQTPALLAFDLLKKGQKAPGCVVSEHTALQLETLPPASCRARATFVVSIRASISTSHIGPVLLARFASAAMERKTYRRLGKS